MGVILNQLHLYLLFIGSIGISGLTPTYNTVRLIMCLNFILLKNCVKEFWS